MSVDTYIWAIYNMLTTNIPEHIITVSSLSCTIILTKVRLLNINKNVL